MKKITKTINNYQIKQHRILKLTIHNKKMLNEFFLKNMKIFYKNKNKKFNANKNNIYPLQRNLLINQILQQNLYIYLLIYFIIIFKVQFILIINY